MKSVGTESRKCSREFGKMFRFELRQMDIRTFRAESFEKALDLAQTELGPDVRVLHARDVGKPSLFGFISRKRIVEITASPNFEESRRTARWEQVLFERLEFEGPISAFKDDECKIIAMIGGSGVGKTSMISKLAIKHREKKIGLISVDTHRPGANRPLADFAKALDIPCEIVLDLPGMEEAKTRFEDRDFLFIDTPGTQIANTDSLQETCEFLDIAMVHEVHLVLPCTATATALRKSVRRFAPLGISGITLSKFDEAADIENLLPFFETNEFPLRYLSYGPSLSGDFEPASSDFFLNLLKK